MPLRLFRLKTTPQPAPAQGSPAGDPSTPPTRPAPPAPGEPEPMDVAPEKPTAVRRRKAGSTDSKPRAAAPKRKAAKPAGALKGKRKPAKPARKGR